MKKIIAALCCLPLLLSAQIQFFNAGIGGHNTRNGLKRINNLLMQYKPTILVIGFGANDAVNSRAIIPENEFKENFVKMIAAARKNGVRTIVLNSCNPCIDSYLTSRHKYKNNALPSELIKKYNKIIAAVCAENKVFLTIFMLL